MRMEPTVLNCYPRLAEPEQLARAFEGVDAVQVCGGTPSQRADAVTLLRETLPGLQVTCDLTRRDTVNPAVRAVALVRSDEQSGLTHRERCLLTRCYDLDCLLVGVLTASAFAPVRRPALV